MPDQITSDFEKTASSRASESIVSDFWYFFRNSKKWWLVPVFALMLLFGVLMLLSGTAAAPFIYTLF